MRNYSNTVEEKFELIEYIALNKCGNIDGLNEQKLETLLLDNVKKYYLNRNQYYNKEETELNIKEYINWLKIIGNKIIN